MLYLPISAEPPARTQTHAPVSYNPNLRQESDPYQPRVPRVIQRNFHAPLAFLRAEIAALQERVLGWDGYNAPAPDARAINAALHWAQSLFSEANRTSAGWSQPRVSSDESGNVTLEWRKGARSLELFVTPEGLEYLKVWGPDMVSDMSDGTVTRPEGFRALWNWLHA